MWGRKFGAKEINYLNQCESASVSNLTFDHKRYLGFSPYSWNSHIVEAVLIAQMLFALYVFSLPNTVLQGPLAEKYTSGQASLHSISRSFLN